MEFLIGITILGVLVLCTPVGIWLLKARMTQLENEVIKLRYRLDALAALTSTFTSKTQITDTPAPNVSSTTNAYSPPPVPTSSPVMTPPATAATDKNISPTSKPTVTFFEPPTSINPLLHEPSPFYDWVTGLFTGGRLFVTLGLLLLFIGVAMLLKYVAHTLYIPIGLRFILVALFAASLVAFGSSQIKRKRDFGLYLQGGGLGILFLTIFFAFKFYSMLDPGAAFILLVVIGAATFALSILYNALSLSVLAVTGGFLAPLLTATQHGSHIALFSYYLLLNLVIFAIACVKPWRVLTMVGFCFTFAVGFFWGGQYYTPQFYFSVQTFLIVYFLLYTAMGVVFATRRDPNIRNPIDSAAILATPLTGFGLQLVLVHGMPYGEALSALGLCGFYAALYSILRRNERAGLKVLSRVFMALSILFGTLTIPYSFSAHVTAPLWACEAAALLWVLSYSKQKLYGYAGLLLLLISDMLMLSSIDTLGTQEFYLLSVWMALAHFFSSVFLKASRAWFHPDQKADAACALVGMLWWLLPGLNEIKVTIEPGKPYMAWLIFLTASSLSAQLAYRRFALAFFDKLAELQLPALMVCLLFQAIETGADFFHPLMDYGWIAFPFAFGAHGYWLKLNKTASDWHYTLAYFLLFLLTGFELGYWLFRMNPVDVQHACGGMLAAAAGIGLLVSARDTSGYLPMQKFLKAGIPLAAWMSLLCFYSFTQSRAEFSIRYIPLFNVLELSEIISVAALFILLRRRRLAQETHRIGLIIFALLSFSFFNAIALRLAGHMLGLSYLSDTMFSSPQIQTLLTLLWTVIAMIAMIVSSKYHLRVIWAAGAALLAVVVVKLFLVDLSGTGTLSRILSFIGVGLLTLLLGYLAPLPPKEKEYGAEERKGY